MKPLNVFEIDYKGFNLVEASAGTGKTYSITSLYIRAIIEKGWKPSQILTLTYTEDATTELRQRIRKRIEECISFVESDHQSDDDFLNTIRITIDEQGISRLKEALFSFDEAVISTIHGFCQKLLREYSLEFGVQADYTILKDTSEAIQDAVDEYWRSLVKDYSYDPTNRGILEYLQSQKFNPDNLSKVVKNYLGKPYAKLNPDSLSEKEIEKFLNKTKDLFNRLNDQWNTDKEKIIDIFNSGKLYGNTYKTNLFDGWFMSMERFLDSGTISITGFDKLTNFSASTIKTKTKNAFSVEMPTFCYLVDEYLELIQHADMVWVFELKRAITKIEKSFNEIKKNENALSFDDLLQVVESNLNPKLQSKIADKFPLALVDEFQDTDPVQYSIFQKIFSKSSSALFMIGDPKQAIYSFRGADLFTYFKATKNVGEQKKYSLNNNYRSSNGMITAVNKLYSSSKDPFLLEEPKFRPAQFPESKKNEEPILSHQKIPNLKFVKCDADGNNKDDYRVSVATYVAKQIQELITNSFELKGEDIQLSDIAILIRTRKWIDILKTELSRLGIRSSVKSKESVFKTSLSKELLVLLRCIHDNENSVLVRAGLITSLINFKSSNFNNFKEDSETWLRIERVFAAAHTEFEKNGIIAAFQKLDSFFDIRKKLAGLHDSERLLTDLDHILELLSDEERNRKLTPASLIRYHKHRINDNSVASDEEFIRIESEKESVTICTLHSSKGLEYGITFLPDLWESFERKNSKGINLTEFHNSKNDLSIDLRQNLPDEILVQSKKETLADQLRLNYVALTRSKFACFIPFGLHTELVKSPLYATVSGADDVIKPKGGTEEHFVSKLIELSETDYISYTDSNSELAHSENLPNRLQQRDSESLKLDNLKNERVDLYNFSRLISFSSLTSEKKQDTYRVSDEFNLISESGEDDINSTDSITKHSFPKGKDTGNLLHYIFEEIEFSNNANHDKIIDDQVNNLGFDADLKPFLKDWISECLNIFITNDLRLCDLHQDDVLKEMEFHFPVANLSVKELLSVVRVESENKNSNLSEDKISGFMKGFIDLIFRYKGKYFILDYKSNYLGETEEDYAEETLMSAMKSSFYDIQYYIYSLALKKFLESRNPDTDFETVFGGVIYLFLRGIDINRKGQGVFFDKPSTESLNKLENTLEDNLGD